MEVRTSSGATAQFISTVFTRAFTAEWTYRDSAHSARLRAVETNVDWNHVITVNDQKWQTRATKLYGAASHIHSEICLSWQLRTQWKWLIQLTASIENTVRFELLTSVTLNILSSRMWRHLIPWRRKQSVPPKPCNFLAVCMALHSWSC